MRSGRFGSVVAAMVTPFDEEGRLDLDAAAGLARWLVAHGNDGLVVAGTTGESPTLSDQEKCDLWRAVADAVNVPVVAGTGTNDTAHTVALTRRAASCGVAGVLIVTPYYNRPSQAGLEAHFRAAASAAGEHDLPVMLYDVPARAGRAIGLDVRLNLARDVPNIVALKDAVDDLVLSARFISEAPSSFEVYSGSDSINVPLLSVGAVGFVSVASHWTGELHADLLDAWAKGDVQLTREINARLIPSYAFESSDAAPNPIPTKMILRLLGLAVGRGRPPMDVEPPGLEAEARAILAGLGMAAMAGADASD